MEKIGKIWNKLEKFGTNWKNLEKIAKILNKFEIAKDLKQVVFVVQTISWSAYRLKVFQSCYSISGNSLLENSVISCSELSIFFTLIPMVTEETRFCHFICFHSSHVIV